MPWSLNRITEELHKLQQAVPLTFNWYTGRTQPKVAQEQIVFWEDINNEIAKILMRRGSKTYIFSSYLSDSSTNITINLDNHAHRHATSGSTKPDVGADPIGPYNFTWTGAHTWSPGTDTAPITINKTSALTSARLIRVFNTDNSDLFVLSNVGLVGINTNPDAMLTIRGGGLAPPITSGLLAWYHAESLSLSNGADVNSWQDSSGNGNNLTSHGRKSSGALIALRPHYNSAGTSKGTTNLPTVSLEGDDIADVFAYFTIDTGSFTFTLGSGWTICMIVRDYGNFTHVNRWFSTDNVVPNTNEIRSTGGGSNLITWLSEVTGTDVFYCSNFAHTDGNSTEATLLRNEATSGQQHAWINGVQQAGGQLRTTGITVGLIGAQNFGGSWSGVYGKAVAEILIYNRALTDPEVALVNTYLLNRIAGTVSTTTYDLTRWKLNSGSIVDFIDKDGNVSWGANLSVTGTVTFSAGNFDVPVTVDLAPNSAGVATTFARSDHKHDFSEAIVPLWTGLHSFDAAIKLTVNSNGTIYTEAADAISIAGFSLVDRTPRSTGNIFEIKESTTGNKFMTIGAQSGMVVGYDPALVPIPNVILGFQANDLFTYPGNPAWMGIIAQVAHRDPSQTVPRFFGIVGSTLITTTAASFTAPQHAGVKGHISSDGGPYGAAQVAACFTTGVTRGNSVISDLASGTIDPSFGMTTQPQMTFDHVTGYFCNVLNASVAGNYPGTFPNKVSSARLCIQDWGAPTTDIANTTEYWSIRGENVNGALVTFPQITGYLRMTYPRRTGRTGVRAMQIWWEPWPNTAAIRGGSAIGDTYFDDGTNFLKGIHQSVVAGAFQALLYPTANANGAVAAGNAGSIVGLWQFDHMQQVTFDDAKDIIFNATTGTKIGTAAAQKIGKWGAAPIAQPTVAVAAAVRVAGGGAAVTDTDTFDGYTLAQLVRAFRLAGNLA